MLVGASDKPKREGAPVQVVDDGATARDAGPASPPAPGCPTAAVGEHFGDFGRHVILVVLGEHFVGDEPDGYLHRPGAVER